MYQVNLLLIEDCQELKEILHWDIESNFPSLNILSCCTFKEASATLETNSIQIVISDFYLNGSNSLELYEKYKNSVHFIMMSGDGSVRNIVKNRNISFIEKPFNSSALTRIINLELEKLTYKNSQNELHI